MSREKLKFLIGFRQENLFRTRRFNLSCFKSQQLPSLINQMTNQAKSIIVTGSNKGIGYGIVEGLLKQGAPWHIIMACRNTELAEASRKQLLAAYPQGRIEVQQLDVSSEDSVEKFVKGLEDKKHGIDVLVNNAGVIGNIEQYEAKATKSTLATNFYGTIHLSERIIPVLNKNGKIIIVGSALGMFNQLKSEELTKRWKKPEPTRQELFDNITHFVDSINDNSAVEKGYPKMVYSISKLAINLFAGVLSRSPEIKAKNLQVYTLCPGYVSTDMNGHKGHLTIDQGAETPLYLINLPFEVNPQFQGQFFRNSKLSSLAE